MAVSKVILNGTTLMDTTDKTVSNDNMLSGETALKNDGTTVTGNIIRRDSTQVRVTNNKVDIPKGYYGSSIVKIVSEGTAGTPTATKGTVSNNSVSVTPSVTNTTGYITGGTKTGSAVTVNASELVSGTKSITENGTGIDVTNYAAVDVSVSGGGSSSVTIEPLSVTQNGTYTAPSGTAYSPVTVNVSGGGASEYTLVASEEVEVSTTSTTAATVISIPLPDGHIANAIYYVKIRDKAGKRRGYVYGTDQWFIDLEKGNGTNTSIMYSPKVIYFISSEGKFGGAGVSSTYPASTGYGVYASAISGSGSVTIQSKYGSAFGTVDGTFSIEVYKLKWPGDISPLV